MASTPTIHAILVTHQPGEDLHANVQAILPQISQLIIVDNNSGLETLTELEQLKATHPDTITLMPQEDNLGLAAAQNLGIQYALDAGADWVLLLDDDSRPEPDMVQAMLEAWQTHPDKETIGILAPHILETATKKATAYIQARAGNILFRRQHFETNSSQGIKTLYPVLVVIASGSLIHRETLEKAGPMIRDFFIDYIDSEYCLRAAKHGYRTMVIRDAVLRHRLGAKTTHTLMGQQITTSNHSAQRRYTIYRNRIWVWRQYWRHCFPYILYDFLAACYDPWRILFFEREKTAKLRAILRGFWHGITRKPSAIN